MLKEKTESDANLMVVDEMLKKKNGHVELINLEENYLIFKT